MNALRSSNAQGRSRWSYSTPLLWYCVALYAMGDLIYGIDTGSFGSLQALPSWLNRFGQTVGGKKVLTPKRQSIMNSVVWIGKLTGTVTFEPILERTGYRVLMYIVCVIQCVAIIIELTSHEWIQFSVGRVLAYLAVGLVENAVPSYTSEIVPVPLRAFCSGSIIFFVNAGNLWGSGLSRAYVTETTRKGWMVPTATQLIPAIILMIGLPFTPESPRWLIAHNKHEQALENLTRLRPAQEIEHGVPLQEVQGIEQAIEEQRAIGNGTWLDLFRGTYLRRAMISAWLFIFQQWTGGQFVNSYGPTFYKQIGLANLSFTYAAVGSAVVCIAVAIGLFLYDKVGRRPLFILFTFLQVPFMIVVAAVGSQRHPSRAAINGVVASVMLFLVSAKVSTSICCFLISSEMGGVRMRKKIMAFGTTWDVIAAFGVTYSTPYMLKVLSAKVGYIFAGISFASFIFAVFFVPELKGRSLEEVDELFEQRLWAWQFNKAVTTGVGARIAALEGAATAVNIEQGKLESDILEQDAAARDPAPVKA